MEIIKKYGWWILTILWMGVIFLSSSQTGEISGSLSTGLSSLIMTQLEALFGINLKLAGFDHFIRKNAHFFVYLILGIFSYLALKSRGFSNPGLKAVLFSLIYAASDEIHQLFVAGRAGRLTDVLIDTLGALVGVFIAYQIKKRRGQRE
ncbi:VanZ family protein [Eubacteriaceae bacterium ES3]|nr:VanZ family protein [Eubacteriaceae bacterium ES3]